MLARLRFAQSGEANNIRASKMEAGQKHNIRGQLRPDPQVTGYTTTHMATVKLHSAHNHHIVTVTLYVVTIRILLV